MAQELVLLEGQLKQYLPMMQQALMDRMPAERLMRTILVSCEKTPKLLECSRQSLMSAAMTAAVLGLEVDGVTGQAYLIPYEMRKTGKVAQFQMGFKGYNTLAARSGYTITAAVVREKDEFDYSLGTEAKLHHKPSLVDSNARIIAAWAVADSKTLRPIISVLPLADLEAVAAKSKAANREGGFSPWDDPSIGRPAMFEKTARRRLARSMPLTTQTRDYHIAARIEEAFQEQALPSAVRPDGQLIVDGRTESPFPQAEPQQTPEAQDLIGPKPDREVEKWKAELLEAADGGTAVLKTAWERLGKESPRLSKQLVTFLETEAKPKAKEADNAD